MSSEFIKILSAIREQQNVDMNSNNKDQVRSYSDNVIEDGWIDIDVGVDTGYDEFENLNNFNEELRYKSHLIKYEEIIESNNEISPVNVKIDNKLRIPLLLIKITDEINENFSADNFIKNKIQTKLNIIKNLCSKQLYNNVQSKKYNVYLLIESLGIGFRLYDQEISFGIYDIKELMNIGKIYVVIPKNKESDIIDLSELTECIEKFINEIVNNCECDCINNEAKIIKHFNIV